MKLQLREMRGRRGLTQLQVAEVLSCDQSLYSKYERGERAFPLDLAVVLAEFYGITLDQLVGRTELP